MDTQLDMKALKNFFYNSIDFFVILNQKGKFQYVNPTFLKSLEYSEEEIMKIGLKDIILPEDRKFISKIKETALKNNAPQYRYEGRYFSKNKIMFWIDWSIVIEDEVTYAVGRDTTEKKLLENALVVSDEGFSNVFDHSAIGMALVEPDGKIIRVNNVHGEILGYTENEILGKNIGEITHPDDMIKDWQNAAELLSETLKYYHLEKRMIHKDGHIVNILISVSLLRDSAGNPLYFIGQLQDITKNKIIEEHINRATEELKTLFENVADAITVFDINGHIIKTNKGFETVFGWKGNEILGRRMPETIPQALDDTEYLMNTVVSGGIIKDFETIKARKDGKLIDVSISMSPIRDSKNNIIALAAITRDITHAKKMRELVHRAEKLSLVGQMAASITHEIRNPMAVIRGFMQLMKEQDLDKVTETEYYTLIMEELDRANDMISDFLSLSQTRIVKKEFHQLNDIIHTLHPLIQSDANLYDHSIKLDLESSLKPILLNDKEIKQLILNVVRNGIEAMDPGGTMYIKTKEVDGKVVLIIKDNGSGIPQDKMELLFDPFFTLKERGTGLGLSVCKSICEEHGAKIRVDSIEGLGTSFTITFQSPIHIEIDGTHKSHV